jgi:hypothetical protein
MTGLHLFSDWGRLRGSYPTVMRLTMLTMFAKAPAVAAVFLLCAAQAVQAQCITDIRGRTVCPPPDSSCLRDRYGNSVCSPSKGGIGVDLYGVPVCGPGACIKNNRGNLFCSVSPGGYAAINLYAEPVCTDGCMPASADYCVRPQ